jgi:hypothetical protein
MTLDALQTGIGPDQDGAGARQPDPFAGGTMMEVCR